MTIEEAFVATSRLGMGARPGELAVAAADPRAFVLRQLEGPIPLPEQLQPFASGAEVMAQIRASRGPAVDLETKRQLREAMAHAYRTEAIARTRALIASGASFRERLVLFWSNHFTVSIQRPVVMGLVGPFEREAIRPHVTGRFRDMLGAVVKHPAMLLYLDNASSVGPDSVVGERRGRGLNENLGRELMELHTLGVGGGYTQKDVTELARILSGWSIGEDGTFLFRPRAHEPGEKVLLGVRYPDAGMEEGEHALDALARHPATARHVAVQLARHMVADSPPPALVDRLARVFSETDGDLGAVTRALLDADEAWQPEATKVKSPNELVVSALRALAFDLPDDGLLSSLRLLGQQPFAAPSPAGWPDTAAGWLASAALLQRAWWAVSLGRRAGGTVDARKALETSFGPAADPALGQAVARAPSAAEATAMLVASPAFQRR